MYKKVMLVLGFIFMLGIYKANCIVDGNNVIVIASSNTNVEDKSSSISATINGHVLSVVFTENLGQVAISVTYADGGTVDTSTIQTPSGVNIYIAGTGSFVVRFTLRDGDEYWGEFEITE